MVQDGHPGMFFCFLLLSFTPRVVLIVLVFFRPERRPKPKSGRISDTTLPADLENLVRSQCLYDKRISLAELSSLIILIHLLFLMFIRKFRILGFRHINTRMFVKRNDLDGKINIYFFCLSKKEQNFEETEEHNGKVVSIKLWYHFQHYLPRWEGSLRRRGTAEAKRAQARSDGLSEVRLIFERRAAQLAAQIRGGGRRRRWSLDCGLRRGKDPQRSYRQQTGEPRLKY